MRVRALSRCFIGNAMRRPGDEFIVAEDQPLNPEVVEVIDSATPTTPAKTTRKKSLLEASDPSGPGPSKED